MSIYKAPTGLSWFCSRFLLLVMVTQERCVGLKAFPEAKVAPDGKVVAGAGSHLVPGGLK